MTDEARKVAELLRRTAYEISSTREPRLLRAATILLALAYEGCRDEAITSVRDARVREIFLAVWALVDVSGVQQ